LINLDWVHLALPRSPESGVAVSTAGKILSREKRKMWMRFSQSAHILWYVFQLRVTLPEEKRNRNERQRARNLLMRNLLTAFGASRNHGMRTKISPGQISNFFNSWHANFSRSQAHKNLFAQEFRPCVRYRASTKLFRRNQISFSELTAKLASPVHTLCDRRITAILLLPFAVN
jgi:hypothetical protein